MENVYLEKVAKIVEKQPGVRHEVGTSNFYVDRATAEAWRKPHEDRQKSLARKTFGSIGAATGSIPYSLRGNFRSALIGAAVGGAIGTGFGHAIASAGNRQERDSAILRKAKEKIWLSYSRELDYAKRNGGNGYPIVTIE